MFSKSFAVCFPDFFLDLLSRISDNVKSYSSYLTIQCKFAISDLFFTEFILKHIIDRLACK